jgi:hypothetical protein
MKPTIDPIEKIVADALTAAGVAFTVGFHGPDFYLTEQNIFIECKQFYSPRIAKQIADIPDVIVIQGRQAALTFAALIAKSHDGQSS